MVADGTLVLHRCQWFALSLPGWALVTLSVLLIGSAGWGMGARW
jgi:hypothetical protein